MLTQKEIDNYVNVHFTREVAGIEEITIEDLKQAYSDGFNEATLRSSAIKCAECGNIIGLSEDQIKRYCLHQENNYRNCLCIPCTQKWKQGQEMANIKPKDLVYFERNVCEL